MGVIGLAPAFLFVTGVLMWWNRVLGPALRRRYIIADHGQTRKKAAFLAIAGFAAVTLVFAAGSVDPNNPTGTHGLIVIDKIGRHVRFFDPSTFQEISNLEVGVAPHDVAISPDHKFAYIPVYGDGVYGKESAPGHTIAIIDLATRQLTGTIDVSPYQAPHGIQIDAAGKIYVTCDLSRKLLVIDPKTRSHRSRHRYRRHRPLGRRSA
jgi:hypothetical protein